MALAHIFRSSRDYNPTMPSMELESLLGVDGPIAAAFGGDFEVRPEQSAMAAAIDRAVGNRRHLLVEAGTGVGKSFAYLVPAIRAILEHGARVVVATNTIALQEQLLSKDIPLLEKAFADEEGNVPFRTELVKGRGNYLSGRRLELASSRQEKLFPDEASRRSLHMIEDWAYETEDGTLATLPMLERQAVWDRVQSDSGNCMGRRCSNYDNCFYQNARRRMERADLLITNHALFFSDLALRSRDVGFLPKYDLVIIDEAHHAEDVAGEHFGLSISEGSVMHLLGLLYSTRRHTGFLASLAVTDEMVEYADKAIRLVMEMGDVARAFFGELTAFVRSSSASGETYRNVEQATTATIRTPGIADLAIADRCRDLSLKLRALRDGCRYEEDKYELASYADRAMAMGQAAEALVNQEVPGCAYWIESSRTGRCTLACAPVEVAPILEVELFGRESSVILTSATLTISRDPETAFDHCKKRLGCEDAETLLLGSPFDHSRQVALHVDRHMPDPRDDGYTGALTDRIREHVTATDGGAFVLFTSFRLMHRVADMLRDEFTDAGLPVWVHGKDGSRGQILEGFREDERSVLFGTSSFWQGVDVRGRGLRNVIITRLPFDPPDRPIVQARTDMIRERGGNPFMEDALPRAIIRFKQGFGRLIRSAQDEGRVVVLDPRIATKFYGRLFLQALPEGVQDE